MQLHNQRNRPCPNACGLLQEDRDTQVQHVLRILQDSWAQLAIDLELLEADCCGTKQ